MRFGIFSDSHLGVTKFRKMSNLQNAYCTLNNNAFNEAIDILSDKNLDGVIIPGDLFDSPNPDVQSIIVSKSLSKLNSPVYLLGGNHCFSQRYDAIGYHAFDLLDNSNLIKIHREPKIFDFDDCDVTFVPYKHLNPDGFKKIYRGKLRSKSKCSILVVHGYVDLNDDSESEEYRLPKEVAANYDLVIAGHIHIPQMIETDSTSILVPGSLMPSAQATAYTPKPSVYIYDTESKTYEAIPLKGVPKIKEIITDDINATLQMIADAQNSVNDIYFIRYSGKTEDIDEYLYKKANQNSLNLSIQTNEISESISIQKVSDFWTFINESYPEYYDEFKNFLKGE